MNLKPGTMDDFSDSMARAMEEALELHWPRVLGSRPPFVNREYLRLFFVAIAQGVVRHLVENPDAFIANVRVTDEDVEVTEIENEGVVPPPRATPI